MHTIMLNLFKLVQVVVQYRKMKLYDTGNPIIKNYAEITKLR